MDVLQRGVLIDLVHNAAEVQHGAAQGGKGAEGLGVVVHLAVVVLCMRQAKQQGQDSNGGLTLQRERQNVSLASGVL